MRGLGIAKALLLMAIAYMEREGIPLSSLHAGPSVAGLYRSLGWEEANNTSNISF